MKKIFYTAKFEYLKWIFDEKQIVTIVGIVFMHVMIIQPFLNRSQEMQTPVNIVEVFLAVANSKMFLLILPVLFLVIISDFPRIDSDALFFIMRSGRINWLIGQMFFLIKAVMSYLGIIIAYTLLIGASHGYIGNGWSLTVTNYQDFYGAEAVCFIPVELYWQMPPYEAFLKSILLIFGYFMLTGMGLLLFSIYDLKNRICNCDGYIGDRHCRCGSRFFSNVVISDSSCNFGKAFRYYKEDSMAGYSIFAAV